MPHICKILSIESVTHDVRCIRLEKPEHYTFIAGQATDVAINKEGWREQKRPFTFTSLDTDPYLEFTIKCYSGRNAVTKEIGALETGDELILDDPWGAIRYKGEGYFIAGGAGITPFLAIFRQLHQAGSIGKNRLFFSNRTSDDIINKEELLDIFDDQVLFVLTDKPDHEQAVDFIDKAFLQAHVNKFEDYFYVCGPDQMVMDINRILMDEGVKAQSLVFEE